MPLANQHCASIAGLIASTAFRVHAAGIDCARALLAWTGAARKPVTYTIRCNMAGSLNGEPVRGPMLITATGDMNDMVPPKSGEHPYAWTGDLEATLELAGHGRISGNPSRFLIVSAGPTLGFLMMSPDKPHDTPGFLLKTSSACGYDVGSRASAWPLAYESVQPYPGAIHTQAGWFRIDSVEQCEFRAVVADAPGALALAERRSYAGVCAGLGVPDRRRAPTRLTI